MAFSYEQAIISIIVGALVAIIYSLRVLISLERRIVNLDKNIEKLVEKQTKKSKK